MAMMLCLKYINMPRYMQNSRMVQINYSHVPFKLLTGAYNVALVLHHILWWLGKFA